MKREEALNLLRKIECIKRNMILHAVSLPLWLRKQAALRAATNGPQKSRRLKSEAKEILSA